MTQSVPRILLDELEIIDATLRAGTATMQQKARGQEIVNLAEAAPDLLDALSYFYNIMHDYECSVRKGYVKNALQMACEALAKAKGERV